MKTAIKKILPQSAMNFLRDVHSRQGLSRQNRLEFPFGSLSSITADRLAAIFSNTENLQGWGEHNTKISAVFGNRDAFGGVNPGDRQALYFLVRALKPERFLEIGTHIGASMLYIASALKANGRGQMITVDIEDVNDPAAPWREGGMPTPPREVLHLIGCTGRVSFVQSTAQDFLAKTQNHFDFIFLDGDHSASSVYAEVSLALRCLNPGGIILLHDYYPGGQALFPDGNVIFGPYLAMRRICKDNTQIGVLPLGELPWPTKQGSCRTSLALVVRNG